MTESTSDGSVVLLPFVLFLDIDGVLNTLPGVSLLDPRLVANLNWICDHTQPSIVINSAWNQRDLDTLKEMLVEVGFSHPDRVIGKTDGCQGGGKLVRQWLRANDHVGTPFAIVDDSDNDYAEMWGRLIKCDSRIGLGAKEALEVKRVYERATGPLDEDIEREYAATYLFDNVVWLAQRTPWLQDSQRDVFLQEKLDLIKRCLTMPGFLEAAMMQEKGKT